MNQQLMSDREIMDDILASQKHIASAYNISSNECVNQQLRADLLNILRDEHSMQQTVFEQMSTRGWYCPASADIQKVSAAYTKFSLIQQSL